jgi:serine/alanine adding enzyme
MTTYFVDQTRAVPARRESSNPVMAAVEPGYALPGAVSPDARVEVVVHSGRARGAERCSAISPHPSYDPAWLAILRAGFGHETFLLEANCDGQRVGTLPLALVRSLLFGRFLVSLPFINAAGVHAANEEVQHQLIDRAAQLADEQQVRYLELRHEAEVSHPALTQSNHSKALLRLSLPPTSDALWNGFKSKLRSQIRSGEKHGFEIVWGRHERLNEFYSVFSRNMRDLGTPVFPRRLFTAILDHFAERAELCVVRLQGAPVAAALLTHGASVTEVPCASSLRESNSLNANMVMYWHLLQRAVERGQQTFDFGRSTIDSSTFRFKRQWGAQPTPSVWQYYVRRGNPGDLRPDNATFSLARRLWRHLPLWLTRIAGPAIVRGIP